MTITAKKPREHKWDNAPVDESCELCGVIKAYAYDEPCEDEDLTMWCNPGESVSEMLARQSEKD